MVTIAFFAHDERDAAVRRRVAAFQAADCEVIGFAMRRSERVDLGWNRVDLGRTFDAKYFQRIGAVVSGAGVAASSELLSACDVIYARNLDMALCARLALAKARLSRPVIYECLDIHKLMHRRDLVGALMRGLERQILHRAELLVVSSPAFLREYFEPQHQGRFEARLIENRIAESPGLGDRPAFARSPQPPLRIGWFGVLRCQRSLDIIESIASKFGDRVEIVLRGYPDVSLPKFHERVRRHPNMRFRGRYRSPDDLHEIYESIDVIWAGDFHDSGFNSKWLLPNRLYEGGYFGVPPIAPADCETGRWVEDRGAGFTLAGPIEESFLALVSRLLENAGEVRAASRALLSLPRETFIQPAEEMRNVIDRALGEHRATLISPHARVRNASI